MSPVAKAATVNTGVKPVDTTGFESVAPPLPVVVNTNPDGNVNLARYVPGSKPSMKYNPLEFVVAVAAVPSALTAGVTPSDKNNATVTPANRGSPLSCTPSRSVSTHTTSPIPTRGTTPASIVGFTKRARVAESVSATVSPDTAKPTENVGVTPVVVFGFESKSPPEPVVVNTYPVGGVNFT